MLTLYEAKYLYYLDKSVKKPWKENEMILKLKYTILKYVMHLPDKYIKKKKTLEKAI